MKFYGFVVGVTLEEYRSKPSMCVSMRSWLPRRAGNQNPGSTAPRLVVRACISHQIQSIHTDLSHSSLYSIIIYNYSIDIDYFFVHFIFNNYSIGITCFNHFPSVEQAMIIMVIPNHPDFPWDDQVTTTRSRRYQCGLHDRVLEV